MITKDETQVKPMLFCDLCTETYDQEHRDLPLDSRGRVNCHRRKLHCDTCGMLFRPLSTTPPAGLRGWQIHNCSPCPHCGAPRRTPGHEYCTCPEGQAEKAKNRVADKIAFHARAKAAKIAGEKHVKAMARYEEELAESKRSKLSPQEKAAQRDQLDTELRDRDQALKGRELSRRERRQDGYDAAADPDGQVPGGEPLEAFVGKMAEADAAPPSALLRRSDGEILFYDGEVNWVFGEPGSGKSWLALYVVQESILRGQRTVFWDHEMSPGQTKARCLALGLDLVEAERDGKFLYLNPNPPKV